MGRDLTIETNTKPIDTLLKDISEGNICVPPFQREYVWDRDDVKDLFDSIGRNFPIGSILIWKPAAKMGWQNIHEVGSFTLKQKDEQEWYILDGFQRLSSLFGCLTNPDKCGLERNEAAYNSHFNLFYDLKSEEFLYLRNATSHQPYQVPLYVLMSTSDFRQYSRMYMESVPQDQIDTYLNRADALTNRLKDYRIACIEIKNANIEEAVEIFSRLNSKGMDISYDWTVNALSYQDGQFKFADEISNVLKQLKPYGFDRIPRNAIFRCIQSSFGKLYIDNQDIEHLAKRDDFAEVTRATMPVIVQAVKFLNEELKVKKYQLLPYNTQLIYVMEFFRQIPEPTDDQKADLKRWFWMTSYSNYFTISQLGNQRKAYNQFKRYLSGEPVDIFYGDEEKQPYTTMPFPKQVTLRGVRSRTLVLFINNFLDRSMYSSEDAKLLEEEDYNTFVEHNKSLIVQEERKYVESLGLKYFEPSDNPKVSTMIDTVLESQQKEFTCINKEGIVEFDYKRNSGRYIIGSGLFSFETMWSECGERSVYCYRDCVKRLGYNPDVAEIPGGISAIAKTFDFTSRCHSVSVGEVVILENKDGNFAGIKVLDVEKSGSDIGHKLRFEYKIYG